jgi:hypothetical protein
LQLCILPLQPFVVVVVVLNISIVGVSTTYNTIINTCMLVIVSRAKAMEELRNAATLASIDADETLFERACELELDAASTKTAGCVISALLDKSTSALKKRAAVVAELREWRLHAKDSSENDVLDSSLMKFVKIALSARA